MLHAEARQAELQRVESRQTDPKPPEIIPAKAKAGQTEEEYLKRGDKGRR